MNGRRKTAAAAPPRFSPSPVARQGTARTDCLDRARHLHRAPRRQQHRHRCGPEQWLGCA